MYPCGYLGYPGYPLCFYLEKCLLIIYNIIKLLYILDFAKIYTRGVTEVTGVTGTFRGCLPVRLTCIQRNKVTQSGTRHSAIRNKPLRHEKKAVTLHSEMQHLAALGDLNASIHFTRWHKHCIVESDGLQPREHHTPNPIVQPLKHLLP